MSDWLLMGYMTPTEEFQTAGGPIRGEIFRFSSTTWEHLDKRYRTFGFAKVSYLGGGEEMDSRWYRFYPGVTPVILEIPLPEEFYKSGFVSRFLEIRQASLRYPGELLEWDLKIERYDPQDPPTEIVLP